MEFQPEFAATVKDAILFNDAIASYANANRIGNIILAAKWGEYTKQGGIRQNLIRTISSIKDPSTKIWILRQVPKPSWNVPTTLASAVARGYDPADFGVPLLEYRKESQRQDPLFEGLALKFPAVSILDPAEFFATSSGLCRVSADGNALYCDDSHLSAAGAQVLRPLFESVFKTISKGTPLQAEILRN